MKLQTLSIIIFAIIWILYIGGMISFSYGYNVKIGSYYELSAVASTATLKLEHLNKFNSEIVNENLNTGQSTWLLPTPYTSLDYQFNILQSLRQRLQAIQNISEDTFEYQQAMYQISRNEYCGTDDAQGCLDVNIFYNGYAMRNGIIYHLASLLIIIIILTFVTIFGIIGACEIDDRRRYR